MPERITGYNQNNFFCRITALPRVVNIIRDIKDSRNTACGHNDFFLKGI